MGGFTAGNSLGLPSGGGLGGTLGTNVPWQGPLQAGAAGGGLGSGILGALGGMGGGGGLSSFAPLASLIPGVGPFIGAALPAIDMISGLFGDSPGQANNTQATATQQNVETWMNGIQDQVQRGSMAPDVAIQTIQNMLQSMQGEAMLNESSMRAYGMAQRMASQLIANFQGKQNWMMNAKFDPNMDRFGIAGNAESGYTPMSEGMGKERGRTLIREMLMGSNQGQAFGEHTGAGRLTQGPFDVEGAFGSAMDKYGGTADRVKAGMAQPTQLGGQIQDALGNIPKIQYGNNNNEVTL